MVRRMSLQCATELLGMKIIESKYWGLILYEGADLLYMYHYDHTDRC